MDPSFRGVPIGRRSAPKREPFSTPIHNLIYASSSSVYGGARKVPFSTSDGANHPVSLYVATKKANEMMAHAYADLYGIPATGLLMHRELDAPPRNGTPVQARPGQARP